MCILIVLEIIKNEDKFNLIINAKGQYLDKYGNVCSHKNKKRHIAPLDQMYIRKKSKHENNKLNFKI
jgi:hypothetical protein